MKLNRYGLVLFFLTALWGRSLLLGQEPSPQQSTEVADEGDGASEAAAKKPFELPKVEPPDGEWQVAEDGRRYFLATVPKIEGLYHWIDEEKRIVKALHHPAVIVEREDEHYFYTRVYESRRITGPEPTAVDLEAIERSYAAEPKVVDRLRFVPFDAGLPQDGQWRNGFDVADMNGDGHLDLVHGPARKSLVPPVVFLGDGAGHWKPWPMRFPPVTFDYGDVAVDDFNGDGHPDLALAAHLRGLLVLIGDGKGSFELWSKGLPTGEKGEESFGTRAVTTGDWNADGRPDLIALSEGPSMRLRAGDTRGVRIYLNGGDGTWSLDRFPDDSAGNYVQAVDLNRDGRLDLVADSIVQSEDRLLYLGQPEGAPARASVPKLRPRAFLRSVREADVDADGWMDLLVAFKSFEADKARFGVDALLSRNHAEEWERVPIVTREKGAFFKATGGDLDRDGQSEIVVAEQSGALRVFRLSQDGVEEESSPELEPEDAHYGCQAYDLQVKDLNADGHLEIIAIFAGEPDFEQQISSRRRPKCSSRGAVKVWTLAPQERD